MIRTQVQLTDSQARSLKRVASREGISLAEAVRRCVDRALSEGSSRQEDAFRRAAALVGAFADRGGAPDVAESHDRYLGEAV
ncbi:MAG: CopG family transcriptional regulator [Holophagales bacterium]|jgi:hypothetical protein|nr:MAG: CopG family transcriptional regulator [Holophagales bacterium]